MLRGRGTIPRARNLIERQLASNASCLFVENSTQAVATLNLRHCILTWDAINTRAVTLDAVVKALADFLVCLKANQGELFDVIEEAFS